MIFGRQNRSKNLWKNQSIFLLILHAIWSSFWKEFGADFQKNGSSRAMVRPYESVGPASKIEGLGPCWMSQKRPNSVQLFHWKIYRKIGPNLKQNWCILGAKMEPKSIKKSMFFLIDFLEAPKTLRNHWGSSGGAPRELRGSSEWYTFSRRGPQKRPIIKRYRV